MHTRDQAILARLEARGFVSPEEMAQALGVSAATARRDLARLEAAGRVRRVHGGAMPAGETRAPVHFGLRLRERVEQKRAIARCAAGLIQPGETIFLDAGSTCYFLADSLPEGLGVTVVTHSLDNMSALRSRRGVTLIGLGGQLDPTLCAFTGPMTEGALQMMSATRAFLGAAGIDPVRGCTNNSIVETRVKSLMNERATNSYVLADGSKFSQPSLWLTIAIDQVRHVITDATAPPEGVELLRRRGIDVLIAS